MQLAIFALHVICVHNQWINPCTEEMKQTRERDKNSAKMIDRLIETVVFTLVSVCDEISTAIDCNANVETWEFHQFVGLHLKHKEVLFKF